MNAEHFVHDAFSLISTEHWLFIIINADLSSIPTLQCGNFPCRPRYFNSIKYIYGNSRLKLKLTACSRRSREFMANVCKWMHAKGASHICISILPYHRMTTEKRHSKRDAYIFWSKMLFKSDARKICIAHSRTLHRFWTNIIVWVQQFNCRNLFH